MTVVALLYNSFFGYRSAGDPGRPRPDWAPPSFMFVISGPAPVDSDLDGGTWTDESLVFWAGQPASSFSAVHTFDEGALSAYFPNFMSSYSCREEEEKRTQSGTRNLKRDSYVNLQLMLPARELTSSSDRYTSSMSLSSDSLSGSSLSSCAVFSYSWQRISSFWRP